jgi:hypothetical protein
VLSGTPEFFAVTSGSSPPIASCGKPSTAKKMKWSSVEFSDTTIQRTFRKILGPRNFLLFYSPPETVQQLPIL